MTNPKILAFVSSRTDSFNKKLAKIAARVEDENRLLVKATKPTELLLIDLPEKYSLDS